MLNQTDNYDDREKVPKKLQVLNKECTKLLYLHQSKNWTEIDEWMMERYDGAITAKNSFTNSSFRKVKVWFVYTFLIYH